MILLRNIFVESNDRWKRHINVHGSNKDVRIRINNGDLALKDCLDCILPAPQRQGQETHGLKVEMEVTKDRGAELSPNEWG